MYDKLYAFEAQRRQQDFASVKAACPKGIYLAPALRNASVWHGILFVRKGPYAPAILRFQVHLYPADKPPAITISTEIFHPLITPLTTYTYTTGDTGTDTVSATDEDRLPPGGLSLRHAFPQWFGRNRVRGTVAGQDSGQSTTVEDTHTIAAIAEQPEFYCGSMQIVQALFYLRSVFDSDHVLDKIPLAAAANPGAWHAWNTHRAKRTGTTLSAAALGNHVASTPGVRQQPGGARRPGQWNWDGVWEERVKKGVQASISQHALYGSSGPGEELVGLTPLSVLPTC
ncbi:hypothetical protein MBLNU459_g8488t2 [Dothideomycetes sp. NU459]